MEASPASTTLRGSVSKNAALYMPETNMPPMMPSPVVHDAAGAQAHLVGRLRQARRHQPDEIGFDLEIDVVGVRVVAAACP